MLTIKGNPDSDNLTVIVYRIGKEPMTEVLKATGRLNDIYERLSYGYYCCIEGIVYTLRDAIYFQFDKYGDFNPFIDYCWACWFERLKIDFAEYEQIRSFFED